MDPNMQQQPQYYYAPGAPAGAAPPGYYAPQAGASDPTNGYVLPMQPQPQMMYYAPPASGYAYAAPGYAYYQPPEAAFAALSLSGQQLLPMQQSQQQPQPQQTPGASSTTSNGSQPRAASTPIPPEEPASLAPPCNPAMVPMQVMYTQSAMTHGTMMEERTHDVDLLPASSSSSTKVVPQIDLPADVVTIVLSKDEGGFGFNVVGGSDSQHLPGDNGIFVSLVQEDGVAAREGQLKEGDKILSVNGVDLSDCSHDAAVKVLREIKMFSEATLVVLHSLAELVALSQLAPIASSPSTRAAVVAPEEPKPKIFTDPGIDLTTKPIVVQMRQMTLNRRASHISKGANGAGDMPPSFLGLPNELITYVINRLPIADRMRARRVNKQLHRVEATSTYHVERLIIKEQSINAPPPVPAPWNQKDQHVIFYKERSYTPEAVRKISSNATVDHLCVRLDGLDSFHREVYQLLKGFNVATMSIDFGTRAAEREMLTRAFLRECAAACRCLQLANSNGCLTGPAIYGVYTLMRHRKYRIKLRLLWTVIRKAAAVSFLEWIGVTINREDGQFVSRRRVQATAFEHVHYYESDGEVYQRRIIYIFDGLIEAVFHDEVFADGIEKGTFQLKLHESPKALKEAMEREGLEKLPMAPY